MLRTPNERARLAGRRKLIELSRRRQRAGAGSHLLRLMQEVQIMDWWKRVEADLSRGGVHHAIVGGVAANQYMPPRETADIDIAVVVTARKEAEQWLASLGWERTGPLAMADREGTAWVTPDGRHVDLIFVPTDWGGQAIREARDNPIDGLPILPLAYLVLMKLEASRLTDTGDIARMLGHQTDEALDGVREVIRRHGRTQDVEDLESIIELGRLEYEGG